MFTSHKPLKESRLYNFTIDYNVSGTICESSEFFFLLIILNPPNANRLNHISIHSTFYQLHQI